MAIPVVEFSREEYKIRKDSPISLGGRGSKIVDFETT